MNNDSEMIENEVAGNATRIDEGTASGRNVVITTPQPPPITATQRYSEEGGTDCSTHKVQKQNHSQENVNETEKDPADIKAILAMLDAAIPPGTFKKRGRPRKNPDKSAMPSTTTTTLKRRQTVKPIDTPQHLSSSIKTAQEAENDDTNTKRATSTSSLRAKHTDATTTTTPVPATQKVTTRGDATRRDSKAEVSIETMTRIICAAISRLLLRDEAVPSSESILLSDFVDDVQGSLMRNVGGVGSGGEGADQETRKTKKSTAIRARINTCVAVMQGLGVLSVENAGSITVLDTSILSSAADTDIAVDASGSGVGIREDNLRSSHVNHVFIES